MSFGFGRISLGPAQTEPEIRLYVILRNSKPLQVEETQSIFSLTRSTQVWDMLCRFSIPFGSKLVVLFNAFTIFVSLPQFNLSVGVAPFRSFLVPLQRFLRVGGSEPIIFIGIAQPELDFRVALFGSPQHPPFAHRWVDGLMCTDMNPYNRCARA